MSRAVCLLHKLTAGRCISRAEKGFTPQRPLTLARQVTLPLVGFALLLRLARGVRVTTVLAQATAASAWRSNGIWESDFPCLCLDEHTIYRSADLEVS